MAYKYWYYNKKPEPRKVIQWSKPKEITSTETDHHSPCPCCGNKVAMFQREKYEGREDHKYSCMRTYYLNIICKSCGFQSKLAKYYEEWDDADTIYPSKKLCTYESVWNAWDLINWDLINDDCTRTCVAELQCGQCGKYLKSYIRTNNIPLFTPGAKINSVAHDKTKLNVLCSECIRKDKPCASKD